MPKNEEKKKTRKHLCGCPQNGARIIDNNAHTYRWSLLKHIRRDKKKDGITTKKLIARKNSNNNNDYEKLKHKTENHAADYNLS